MSLLLGIYIKKETDKAFIERMLEIFTLNGERHYKTINSGSLILFLSDNNDNYNFYSSEENTIAVSGRVYCNSPAQAFTIDDNPGESINKSFNEKETLAFDDLEGEYTCVIADNKLNIIYVVNDYWGLYPLYYTDTEDYFVFCNEYEPLTVFPNLKTDNNALAEYFSLGAVLGEKTFFENIKSIPPCSFIELKDNKLDINTCKIKDITINKNITIEEAAARLATLFKESVQKRVNYFQSGFDAMLTGGADTRLILSCLTNEQRQKVKFVSYLTPPLAPNEDADIVIASKLASFLHLDHEVRQFNLWNKPFDESYFNYKRNISTQKYLSGHFGSELLKKEMYKATDKQMLKAIAINDSFFNKIINGSEVKKNLRYIFSDVLLKTINNPLTTLKNEIDKNSFCENKKLMFLFNVMTRSFFTRTWRGTPSVYFDQPAYMPVVFIMPFLDKNLLSFLFSLPEDFFGINHNNIYNVLFKNHFPELLAVETNSPLANDPLSVFKKETTLGDPFNYRNYNYEEALSKLLADKDSLKKYNNSFIQMLGSKDEQPYRQGFIDYEMWRRYVGKM